VEETEKLNGTAADRALRLSLLIIGCLITAAFVISLRWPLIGDEGIIHYIVFALNNGHRPYTEIKDLNLPGSYLLDAFVIRYLGGGDLGERVYDLLLCIIGGVTAVWSVTAGKTQRLAVALGSALFVLIHLQDGVMEAGQRDLAMAVLAMGAYAILIKDFVRIETRIFLFYLIVGLTFTIKPTLLLFIILPLLIPKFRAILREKPVAIILMTLLGFCVFPGLSAIWICARSDWQSVLDNVALLEVLHGSLPRNHSFFLVSHSLSPVNELFACWLIQLAILRPKWTLERKLLVFAAFAGLVSVLLQGKGLPYHRYPFLLFMLALMSLDFASMSRLLGWKKYIGIAILVSYVVVLGPMALWRISRFDTKGIFEDALSLHLSEQKRLSLPGIQCLDTYAGCLNTLYRLRMMQSSGYLYDCYLTLPQSTDRDKYRKQFLDSLTASRPDTIVVTDQPCFTQHEGYDWINRWPELSNYLLENYELSDEWNSHRQIREWNHPQYPASFRIYIRR
jgi:hypothetical protein